MEYDEENNQLEAEFCPVEHPVEPEEEDRPVKCPVPISSALIHVSFVFWKPLLSKLNQFFQLIVKNSFLLWRIQRRKPNRAGLNTEPAAKLRFIHLHVMSVT